MKPYYIATPEGQRKGPFPEEFIRSQHAKGIYNDDTLVWTEGMDDWAPLASVLPPKDATPAPNISNPLSALWYVCKNVRLRGRARRQEYWMAWLGTAIVALAFIVLCTLLSFVDSSGTLANAAMMLYNLWALYLLVVFIALGCRRLHDIGRSGWWQLLYFLPLIGGVVIFIFLCLDSQPGTNAYGENPKGC